MKLSHLHNFPWCGNGDFLYKLTMDSFGDFSMKRRRALLEELNAYNQKEIISKELYKKFRLKARLGSYAQAEEIEAVIKILNNEYPRQNR